MNLFRKLMHAAPDDGAEGGGGPEIPPTPSDEMRSTLEAAFTKSEAAEKPVAAPDGTPKHGETPEQTAARVRDERGRFAAARDVTQTAAAADAQAAGKPVEGEAPKPLENEQARALNAPQSWKPGAREHWNALPPDVQQEVIRREREVAQFAQSTAQARQVYGHLGQLAQQYAPALQAEGVDIVTATQNLMGMVGRLRFGSPQERAQTIVSLVQNYGVDIEALDQALVGTLQPGQQGPQPQQVFQDPRVDQLLGTIQAAQQQRVEQVYHQATSEVEQFGQGKDFFADVREDMADILEVAARRGIEMTLDQAYDRACRLNPEIDKVISQRAAAAAAQNPNGSTARARLASSSVRSTPATPPSRTGDQPKNLRDELTEAWGTAENRGR
jgi:hypothetical protein